MYSNVLATLPTAKRRHVDYSAEEHEAVIPLVAGILPIEFSLIHAYRS